MNDQATGLRRAVEAARYGDMVNGGPGDGAPQAATLAPSMARGAVSFAPAPASRLHHRPPVRGDAPAPASRVKLARAIAVSSGKGGVGKSNIAVNLSVALARMGLKVCLLDADLGLANADVLCNLSPKLTLEHVVNGKCKLWEAMLLAPGGFRLIPGASGVARMANLGPEHRRALLRQLAALERVADMIIIDTGAGLNSTVISFAAAAHTVLLTITPEPTALTDGYGMIKTVFAAAPESNVQVVVNMTGSMEEGEAVFGRVDRVSRTFLQRSLTHAATVPGDPAVAAAVRRRVPFVLYAPEAPATHAVQSLARRLAGRDQPESAEADPEVRRGFVSRMVRWLGRPARKERDSV